MIHFLRITFLVLVLIIETNNGNYYCPFYAAIIVKLMLRDICFQIESESAFFSDIE